MPTPSLDPRTVWVARTPRHYGVVPGVSFPELSPEIPITTGLIAFREMLQRMGLDAERFGTPAWNPLSALVKRGARVTLKPNWVLHLNHSGEDFDCVVTHTSLIAALCAYLFKAEPGRVVIGDAPIQGCDIHALWQRIEVDRWLAPWRDRIEIRDFRLVIMSTGHVRLDQRANETRTEQDYIRFDLGRDSLLEPITQEEPRFRVTMYDPEALARTHRPGTHQFLVARELIEADVVFNLPKLKAHKKSGITGALKNLVGINGHKEYLPHHRKGGGDEGGDCYPGHSAAKRVAEDLLDYANRLDAGPVKTGSFFTADLLKRTNGKTSAQIGLEGSWYGNDTIWRTSLDLQRLLHYGRTDGSLADTPQRAVWSLTDAMLAGEGDGPLAPLPRPLGLLTFARSPAAAEWVHALAMRLDPARLPIVRESFDRFRYPLVDFAPEDVVIQTPDGPMSHDHFAKRYGTSFLLPAGWQGHCELDIGAGFRDAPPPAAERAGLSDG